MIDKRREDLQYWIQDQVKIQESLESITGDASARRYFRICKGDVSYIAVDSPPETEDNPLFVALSKQYTKQGLWVPEVYASDFQQGFMWLSDLGHQQLFHLKEHEDIVSFYKMSLKDLSKIRCVTSTKLGALPCYDAAMLMKEMDLFEYWFLEKLLNIQISSEEADLLKQVKQVLVKCAIDQVQVGVHRDFHSRNIMWYQNKPALIDFQGAVIGPITYDMVSLLKDCYIDLGLYRIELLLKEAYDDAKLEKKLPLELDFKEFRKDFDYMGMQRHIKVLGIFSRLALRDHKADYLKDMPLTLKYLMDAADAYDEFADFAQWLKNTVKLSWEHICAQP